MSTLTATWGAKAACTSADPDLFFPDADTTPERIAEAKTICARCPVKQACLEDAIRRGESDAICGGLTHAERKQLLGTPSGRRAARTSGRQLAVQHGAYLLTSLVQWHKSVEQMAQELGSTPAGVYVAYLILVPVRPGRTRTKRPSALERLLAEKKECLKVLERRGLSHAEIGVVLETSQSMVSAALSVLRQREEAVRRLSNNGQDGLRRLQGEEIRIRVEAGAPLSVQDVIDMAGPDIRRMHGEGKPLRCVAREVGLNRETVRKAYLEMTTEQGERALTQHEMEEAA